MQRRTSLVSKDKLATNAGMRSSKLKGSNKKPKITPYEILLKHSKGSISRHDTILRLSVWPYKSSPAITDGLHDDLLVYVPGSFDEVELAFNHGLLDPGTYDEIADAFEVSMRSAKHNSGILSQLESDCEKSNSSDDNVIKVLYFSRNDPIFKASIRSLKTIDIPYEKIHIEKGSNLAIGLFQLGYQPTEVTLHDDNGRIWSGEDLIKFNSLRFF